MKRKFIVGMAVVTMLGVSLLSGCGKSEGNDSGSTKKVAENSANKTDGADKDSGTAEAEKVEEKTGVDALLDMTDEEILSTLTPNDANDFMYIEESGTNVAVYGIRTKNKGTFYDTGYGYSVIMFPTDLSGYRYSESNVKQGVTMKCERVGSSSSAYDRFTAYIGDEDDYTSLIRLEGVRLYVVPEGYTYVSLSGDSLERVVLGSTVTTVLLTSKSLKEVYIPAGVTNLDLTTVSKDNLVVTLDEGSYAEEYCIDYSIPYKYRGTDTVIKKTYEDILSDTERRILTLYTAVADGDDENPQGMEYYYRYLKYKENIQSYDSWSDYALYALSCYYDEFMQYSEARSLFRDRNGYDLCDVLRDEFGITGEIK